MMMLKDMQGRTVLIKHENDMEFYARDGLNMVPVDEAIIFQGNDVFLTEDQVEDMLSKAGFPGLAFIVNPKEWHPVTVHHIGYYYGDSWCASFPNRRKPVFNIEGKTVDEETYKRLEKVLSGIGYLNGIERSNTFLQNGLILNVQKALEMIGVGEVVTPQSLNRGCAKGEDRPRLLPGDTVKIAMKGKKDVLGVIKSMSSKVTVLRQDGVKMSCPFDKLTRTDSVGFNKELANQADPSVLANFKKTLEIGEKRIFRVKAEKGDFTFPAFPDNNDSQISREGIMSCSCPVCGWRMADVHDSGEFICCYCRITGLVISRSETEVSLLMNRMPGKNRFAIKESKCCGNCGRFEFDVGRQGKRSTGYCPTANQCLQAFNACDLWYPREVKRYESNLRQHITNLHYGVGDDRNTSRNDIRDTVYTEADHKLECDRAEKAKVAYANAYQRFISDMKEVAKKVPLVEETSSELTEEWKKVLDDPC